MDLLDQLQQLAKRIREQREAIQTEEATKTAFVLPFLQILGYDIFNPLEVTPEFTADVGVKKGEKVDYAILRDGQPIMLIECKSCQTDLEEVHFSQLYRYFAVTPAKIGILTNGIVYRFFTDLEESNKMDERPFLELDLLNLDERLLPEIKRLAKQNFNLDAVMDSAVELKYTREIKRLLNREFKEPSIEFTEFLAKKVYNGRLTKSVKSRFESIVKEALGQFLTDKVNERLQTALAASEASPPQATPANQRAAQEEDSEIITTPEEIAGYHLIRTILAGVVDPKRISMRDRKAYCNILLDDNQRKPICRFYFERSKKLIGIFGPQGERKKEVRYPVEDLIDLHRYADKLKRIVAFYEGEAEEGSGEGAEVGRP